MLYERKSAELIKKKLANHCQARKREIEIKRDSLIERIVALIVDSLSLQSEHWHRESEEKPRFGFFEFSRI